MWTPAASRIASLVLLVGSVSSCGAHAPVVAPSVGLGAPRATDHAPADPRLVAAVTSRANETSRIATHGSQTTGRILLIAVDSLVFRSHTGDQRLSIAAIDTLWMPSRATQRGAVLGAIAGGILGGLVGLTTVHAFCDPASTACQQSGSAAVTGVGLGAAVGGLAGAATGTFMHGWRRIYP